jgi:hypothetical protein
MRYLSEDIFSFEKNILLSIINKGNFCEAKIYPMSNQIFANRTKKFEKQYCYVSLLADGTGMAQAVSETADVDVINYNSLGQIVNSGNQFLYTAPSKERVRLSFTCGFRMIDATGFVPNYFYVIVLKNLVECLKSETVCSDIVNSNVVTKSGTCLIELDAGDTLTVELFRNFVAASVVQTQNHIILERL